MPARLKFFKHPFTRAGLLAMETDINAFLAIIGDEFQHHTYMVVRTTNQETYDDTDWLFATIQYKHTPEPPPAGDPEAREAEAIERSKNSEVSKPAGKPGP